MKEFLADLHIHSVLSPCSDLEMTPRNIVGAALNRGLSMIGVTDHNSTRMCRIISDYASTKGLVVIPGAEVTTSEEVHCLALFENWDQVGQFQHFIDQHQLNILHHPSISGHQIIVDADENVICKEKRSLIPALNASVSTIESFVHSLGGLFIPAHVFRRKNGIIYQMGLLPENLNYDALELTPGSYLDDYKTNIVVQGEVSWIFDSDAHYVDQIGKFSTRFRMNSPVFTELKLALKNLEGRSVVGIKRN